MRLLDPMKKNGWAPRPVRKWRVTSIVLEVLILVVVMSITLQYRYPVGGRWYYVQFVIAFMAPLTVPLVPMVVVWFMEQRLAKRLRGHGDRFCWNCLYPLRVGGDIERVVCSECGNETTPEYDDWCRQYLRAPGRFWRNFAEPPKIWRNAAKTLLAELRKPRS